MADMGSDMTSEKYDWFGWMIITAIVFLVIGYAWAFNHGNIQLERAYEQGYEAAVEELMAVVREDVCGN